MFPTCSILILKKLGDELLPQLKATLAFLKANRMRCFVEPEVHDRLGAFSGFGYVETFAREEMSTMCDHIDVVVCLGGDGVLLHAATLFTTSIPPVISFALGSLGFLTSHRFDNYQARAAPRCIASPRIF